LWHCCMIRNICTVLCALFLFTSCSKGTGHTPEYFLDENFISRGMALVRCDQDYYWSDQAFAFPSMEAFLCFSPSGTVRIHVYEAGFAAAVGLSDEIAVMPEGSVVLTGDFWFAIVPDDLSSQFLDEFPELRPLSKETIIRLHRNPVLGDEKDMCVVTVASIIDSYADNDLEQVRLIVSGYDEIFPAAIAEADRSGKLLLNGEIGDLGVFKRKDLDPYAHSVLLASIVAPVKQYCENY